MADRGALPRLRVHPALGVAVQLRPGDHWWMATPPRMEPTTKMTDAFVHRDGWRELTVLDPPPRAGHDQNTVAYLTDEDLDA